MKEHGDDKVTNPDTGNQVKLKSLKGDKGKKLLQKKFEQWAKKQKGKKQKGKSEKSPDDRIRFITRIKKTPGLDIKNFRSQQDEFTVEGFDKDVHKIEKELKGLLESVQEHAEGNKEVKKWTDWTRKLMSQTPTPTVYRLGETNDMQGYLSRGATSPKWVDPRKALQHREIQKLRQHASRLKDRLTERGRNKLPGVDKAFREIDKFVDDQDDMLKKLEREGTL